MHSVWTYPWTMYEEGLEQSLETLSDIGVDAVNLASHYHSVRALQPRFSDALFAEYPAGCYFSPEPGQFSETPISPQQNEIAGVEDPVLETVSKAEDHGIDVHAWTVLSHNTRLSASNPEYRSQSAFGDSHNHALCPSHPEVREYYASVVDALDDRGVAEIQLESLCYPSAFHDHGLDYGHDKSQLDMCDTERRLISQCFCDGCRTEARNWGVDIDAARDRVRSILAETFRDPTRDPPTLGDLFVEDAVLRDLFEFRGKVISELATAMADRTIDAQLSGYVESVEPNSRWPTGKRLSDLEGSLDRMLALCYVSDPNEARDQIATLRRTVSCPIDAGVTLDPSVIDRREQFLALVDELNAADLDQLAVYNHALMTETQLKWLRDAIGRE